MPTDPQHQRPRGPAAAISTTDTPPLAVVLREGFRWFTDRLNDTAADSGDPRISAAAAIVISYVDGEGTRPVEIARAMGVSRQHVHAIVRELTEVGMIITVPDPGSRRDRLIVPTPDGTRRRNRALVQLKHLETELDQRLDPGEFEQLRELLTRLWGPGASSGPASEEP